MTKKKTDEIASKVLAAKTPAKKAAPKKEKAVVKAPASKKTSTKKAAPAKKVAKKVECKVECGDLGECPIVAEVPVAEVAEAPKPSLLKRLFPTVSSWLGL
jgi:hypothetical protein